MTIIVGDEKIELRTPKDLYSFVAMNCDHLQLRAALKANPENFKELWRDTMGSADTALHRCSGQNNHQLLSELLSFGYDVNVKDGRGCTPLVDAVTYLAPHCFFVLLHNGADVNLTGNDGHSAMHWCVRFPNGPYAQYLGSQSPYDGIYFLKNLIQRGADMNKRCRKGCTPLFFANTDVAKVLIDADADLNIRDNKGLTALHYAARVNDFEKVKVLLDGGAEIDEDINKYKCNAKDDHDNDDDDDETNDCYDDNDNNDEAMQMITDEKLRREQGEEENNEEDDGNDEEDGEEDDDEEGEEEDGEVEDDDNYEVLNDDIDALKRCVKDLTRRVHKNENEFLQYKIESTERIQKLEREILSSRLDRSSDSRRRKRC